MLTEEWPLIAKMSVPEVNLQTLAEWRAVAHLNLTDDL